MLLQYAQVCAALYTHQPNTGSLVWACLYTVGSQFNSHSGLWSYTNYMDAMLWKSHSKTKHRCDVPCRILLPGKSCKPSCQNSEGFVDWGFPQGSSSLPLAQALSRPRSFITTGIWRWSVGRTTLPTARCMITKNVILLTTGRPTGSSPLPPYIFGSKNTIVVFLTDTWPWRWTIEENT